MKALAVSWYGLLVVANALLFWRSNVEGYLTDPRFVQVVTALSLAGAAWAFQASLMRRRAPTPSP